MATGPTGRRPLIALGEAIKTPPFSRAARIEAGTLLSRLQDGESLGMPHSRPMPTIGRRCHELRIRDRGHLWRLFYRLDPDALLLVAILDKDTRATPRKIIDLCRDRLQRYDDRGGP